MASALRITTPRARAGIWHERASSRLASAASEAARLPTFAEWCAPVSANLDTLDDAGTRMDRDPLGVDTIWREVASDEQGNPLPRWSLPIPPFDPDTLYGYPHRAARFQVERGHPPLAIEEIYLGDGVIGGGEEVEWGTWGNSFLRASCCQQSGRRAVTRDHLCTNG